MFIVQLTNCIPAFRSKWTSYKHKQDEYWRFSLFGYNIESKNSISKELPGSQITRQQQLSFEIQRQFRPSTQRTVSFMGGIQYYTYQNTVLGHSISVHQRRSPYITAGIEQDYRFMRGGYL
ncbi:hypothetical protein, partial [Pseudomonas aeruginosa]|uniref:hypothetical protein n=1 Tax=Pseudomonas aeruginosa TaxID=287 RepID=UPI001C7CEF59